MIDFPASPADGQVFGATNGVLYKWSAAVGAWLAQNPAPPLGGTGDFFAQGATGWAPGSINTWTTAKPPNVNTGNSGLWYNTATGVYTPPAGRYRLFAELSFNSNASATLGQLRWRKNGAAIPNTDTAQHSANPSAWGSVTNEVTVDANGADTFDLQVQCGVLMSNSYGYMGASPLTGMQGPTGPPGGGKLLQTQSVETGAQATTTVVVPYDDTIPQITEGAEFMTLAVTPQSATSKLVIEVICNASSNAVNNISVSLFQDAGANALATVNQLMDVASAMVVIPLRHVMTSGTTSPTTFRVRMGGAASATVSFNGTTGGRLYGGVLASSIVITEVLP